MHIPETNQTTTTQHKQHNTSHKHQSPPTKQHRDVDRGERVIHVGGRVLSKTKQVYIIRNMIRLQRQMSNRQQ